MNSKRSRKLFFGGLFFIFFVGRVFSAEIIIIGPPPQQFLLTVNINGQGTVIPNLNGNLVAGQTYQMVAKPSPGYAFAGWTGDLNQPNSPNVSFMMQSNMVLVANFVPSPFLAGNYHGQIVPFNLGGEKRSGVLDLALTSEGDFTAKVQLGIDKWSFSGTFLTNGLFNIWLTSMRGRNMLGTILGALHLDSCGNVLTGDFGYGRWKAVATTSIYDAKSNPAPQEGHYTLLIPGGEDSSVQPGGDGYAAISVDGSGKVSVSGRLSDGTPFSEKTFMSGNWCPLHVPLYGKKGYLSGWLTFTNLEGSDIVGNIQWTKSAGIKKGLYQSGFEAQSEVIGSRYDPDNLNVSFESLTLTNGGLAQAITVESEFGVTQQNVKFSGPNENSVSIKISLANGIFSGNVTSSGVSAAIPICGVILPKQNAGGGFFLGTTESGRVYFGP